ncbi:unnamed protein product [Rodentolepis nana]|uniref:Uncharacterized protein n=1 Tax=Rodentolepis nana TaxID=102285 RepID=A0A0R3TTY4_RODNA|nr:unnamed protein product [Rodentolepis nana]
MTVLSVRDAARRKHGCRRSVRVPSSYTPLPNSPSPIHLPRLPPPLPRPPSPAQILPNPTNCFNYAPPRPTQRDFALESAAKGSNGNV